MKFFTRTSTKNSDEHWTYSVGHFFQDSLNTRTIRDTKGAIKIVQEQNRSATARSKHIDIKLQSMKDAVLEGVIKVRYVHEVLRKVTVL